MNKEIFQNQLNRLSEILSNPLENNYIPALKSLLKSYSHYAKKHKFNIQATVILNQPICSCCYLPFPANSLAKFALTCNHEVCSITCLKTYILNLFTDEIEACFQSFCGRCMKIIDPYYIYQAFGGEEELTKIIRNAHLIRVPKFDCFICLQAIPVDLSITLRCNHMFCNDCIKNYCDQQLIEHRVFAHGINCPQCDEPIDVNRMREILDRENFNLYDTLRFEAYKPSTNEEIYFKCIGPDCTFTALVPLGFKSVKCPRCIKEYCPVCRDDVHRNISCEENFETKSDTTIEGLARRQGWKKCPCCKNMCEKISGCNYMKCMSLECNGLNSFCYLCGEQIDSYDHFEDEGPFGKVCNSTRVRNEEDISLGYVSD